MASRTLHLAAAKVISESYDSGDKNRFSLGMLLPDMYVVQKKNRSATHLIKYNDRGEKTIDIAACRALFGDRLTADPLYLGYYLHLVQDLLYHYSLHVVYNWNSSNRENVKRMHNDYRLINRYAIDRYKLENNVLLPENFAGEKLNEMFELDVSTLYDELAEDFSSSGEGETFFFTEKMADDFVSQSAELCLNEINALMNGKSALDGHKYYWRA